MRSQSKALPAVDAGAGFQRSLTASVDARAELEVLGIGACGVGCGAPVPEQSGRHATACRHKAQRYTAPRVRGSGFRINLINPVTVSRAHNTVVIIECNTALSKRQSTTTRVVIPPTTTMPMHACRGLSEGPALTPRAADTVRNVVARHAVVLAHGPSALAGVATLVGSASTRERRPALPAVCETDQPPTRQRGTAVTAGVDGASTSHNSHIRRRLCAGR